MLTCQALPVLRSEQGSRRCCGSLRLERAHATPSDAISPSFSSLNLRSFFLYIQRGVWTSQGRLFLLKIPSVLRVQSRWESAGSWPPAGPLLSTQCGRTRPSLPPWVLLLGGMTPRTMTDFGQGTEQNLHRERHTGPRPEKLAVASSPLGRSLGGDAATAPGGAPRV